MLKHSVPQYSNFCSRNYYYCFVMKITGTNSIDARFRTVKEKVENFLFVHSGNKTKRGDVFLHTTRNVSKIGIYTVLSASTVQRLAIITNKNIIYKYT